MKRTDKRDDEALLREPESAPRAAEPAGPATEVLALQRSAGNRAVATMLARDTTKPKDKPKDAKPAEVTGPRVIHPTIGVIPIESMQWGGQREAPGGPGKQDLPKEIVFSSRQGDHSSALFREALNGQAQDVEVIMPGSGGEVRILLKGALVSNYSVGEGGGDAPTETWTLNFNAAEFERPGEKKDSEEGPPDRDRYPG